MLREEHRLSVFENTMLRTIFGPMRVQAIGDWRKLHNGEFHNLYSSPSIMRMKKSRRITWAGNVAHLREIGNAYRILVGKPEGKRQPGRCRCR
jgi:hypothetical protein